MSKRKPYKTPFKDLLPPLSTEEREALKADIKERGQLDPIYVDEDNNVLDGHNRLDLAGTDAWVETIEGLGSIEEKQAFVLSRNFKRRNLSPDQKAEVRRSMQAVGKAMREQDAKQWTQKRLAVLFGVSHQVVSVWEKASKPKVSSNSKSRTATKPKPDSRVKVSPDAKPKIVAAVASGKSQAQVAADVGVSQKTISNIVKAEEKKVETAKAEVAALKVAKQKGWKVVSVQDVVQCDALITDPPYGILSESWEPDRLEEFTREWAGRWNECGSDFAAIFFSQRYLWDGRKWFDESLSDYSFQQLLVWHYANNKKPQS